MLWTMLCAELVTCTGGWPVVIVFTVGGTKVGGGTDPGACADEGKVVVVYCTLTGVVGNAEKQIIIIKIVFFTKQ